ncbi:hypothetical protein WEB32_31775 [Streptomyces netropsis]|uniref:Drug resistance MFS transporter, drug:H+ antiporter-2 (14 Spanner) (DHA2) family n=1 Tax=Streptomyces netropsis TaxID=55404 RepID=A0A7W7L8F6_STRNE|nr:hypothetical protein [Streptomyces netropsis]MBB4885322.1 hypothetical protein [Streptomyces netropsis]
MTGLPLGGADVERARESVGGAAEVAEQVGGTAGRQVLEAARDAFDDALTTTAYVSAAIVVAVALLTVRLVPRGFRTTGSR